ncbi:MAG: penicillin-binding protein 2 [Ktedonobacteraceae bacterium]|nr:penicillin-binding protein 2 [Ktedonobacteraceae bacterium]
MNTINASIRKLTTLFIALFIALSAGLVYWQVVVARQVTANVHNSRPCLTGNAPIRGRIFDRNGVLLADNIPTQGGCGYLRRYYEPSLAGLIGYYISPLYASTGIEHSYDAYLSGRLGKTALDNTINQTLHRPTVGDDIYLTIDVRIQRIVDHYFDEPIRIDYNTTYPSDRGAVIVTDPRSGEILAMLSRPGFDPNKLVSTISKGDLTYYKQLVADPEQPLLERPLQGRYVPGSTYKTMTLIAGLDSNKTTLDQPFDRQHAVGPVFLSGQAFGPIGNNIQDYTRFFPVTAEYGYAHSDNVIFAQIGVETGASTWLDYNRRFYVGQSIPFDLPVEPSIVLPNGQSSLADNQLGADAFGQGTDFVTPMQMSLIDDAVANSNGQVMQPMLVTKIVDSSHSPIQTNNSQPLGPQQMSAQTATEVRQSMYGVVRCGSGSVPEVKFINSPWGIIGKTGTAELGSGKPPHSWLITQAPYSITNPSQTPVLTIVAMKENGGEGGSVVGPMIADMYNDIFTNVMNIPAPAPPDPNYCLVTKLTQ